MSPLRIEVGELVLALTSHDIEHYLDLTTGLVIPLLEDIEEDEGIPDIDGNPGRYRFIEPVPSEQGYRWMEEFAHEQRDAEIRDELRAALARPRPFRGFRDALGPYSATRAEWFVYEEERLLEYARSWLEGEEIQAELVEDPAT